MEITRLRKVFAFSIFLISACVYGQGTLQGVVTDSLARDPLIGCSVFLVGTAFGDAVDIEGKYQISKIPEGKYRVRFSYVGYKTKEFSLDIKNNETVTLNANLIPDVIQGKELVVSAQALGQAAAINQQINSNTIINVISEQKIQELPDANAAEAIGRLPGVALQRSGGEANKVILRGLSDRFSSITVDGIRLAPTDADSRGVDLSTISQGSLAGIELFKALTPDKDADAIAGSVNLVTRKAPLERVIRFDAKGDYNKINKNLNQYDLAVRYGERFFEDVLGLQITGNLEQRDRSNERVNVNYNSTQINNGLDYEITDFTVEYTNEIRKRAGFSVLLDMDTPDGGSIRLSNIFNRTDRDIMYYNRNYPTEGTLQLFYTARDRQQELSTFNSSLRGENHVLGFTANWAFSFAQSLGEFPYDFELDFLEPSSTDSQGNPISAMGRINPNVLKGPPELIIPFALNNFSKAYLYDAYDRGQRNLDKEKTVFLDLKNKYTLDNSISGEFKFGGKYRYKTRYRENIEYLSPYYLEALRQYSVQENGSVALKNFMNSRFANLLKAGNNILFTNFIDSPPESRNTFDLYTLNPLVNRDALHSWRDINRAGVGNVNGSDPEYRRNLEADGTYYDIVERVSSAYIMNTLNIGQDVTFIAGFRIESENNNYKSKYTKGTLGGFPVPAGTIRDTSASHAETVYLPNFHLTYRPSEFMNIRLAVYKAIARPDFNQRLISSVSRSNGTFYSGNNLGVGNPDLKAAQAWHYEINTSLFSNDIGLFSVSLFYLDVKDMFHLINGVLITGQPILDSLGITWKQPFGDDQFRLTYPYNSSKPTRVWGLEIEHQANLRFLPGLLSNIVLSYNFSLIRSETYVASSVLQKYFVTLPGIPFPVEKSRAVLVETKQRLEGQPEFFGNLAFGYDIGGFSGRISIFYQGDFYRTFSGDGRTDQLTDKYTKWDLALKQQLTDNISVLFNLNNFTDMSEGTSIKNQITGWRLLDTMQRYGLNADLGLRVNL